MKKLIIIVSILVLLSGCGNSTNKNDNTNTVNEEILEKVISQDNYIILDVRTKEEYEEGHVKDSINIEYDKIDEKTDLDKSKTILVYCKSGRRSSIAYETLKNLGYDVFDLGAYESIALEKEQ